MSCLKISSYSLTQQTSLPWVKSSYLNSSWARELNDGLWIGRKDILFLGRLSSRDCGLSGVREEEELQWKNNRVFRKT